MLSRNRRAVDRSVARLEIALADFGMQRDEFLVESGMTVQASQRSLQPADFSSSETLVVGDLLVKLALRRPLAPPGAPETDGHVLLTGVIDIAVGKWKTANVMNLACIYEHGRYRWHAYQLRHHAGPIPEAPGQLRLPQGEPEWGIPHQDWEREVGYGRGPGSHPLEVGYQLVSQSFTAETIADCIQLALAQDPDGNGLWMDVSKALA